MVLATLPVIYMAPLKGITQALFRRVYTNHFSGIDGAIAPFINPQRRGGNNRALLTDLLPKNNCPLPLVPQLLTTDPQDFIALAHQLDELGYSEINWNLGCPQPMIARKKRGAGLLPYPDLITGILDTVLPRISARLSIKMRLGYDNFEESLQLIPRLNHYPIRTIIIHARLGSQLYRGVTYPDQFRACLALSRHHLVYNGDITSLEEFQRLQKVLPEINHWMIGRGLLFNPHLPAQLKAPSKQQEQQFENLFAFHNELFHEQQACLNGSGPLLGKMKQLWTYLISGFPGGRQALQTITRAASEETYLTAVSHLFEAAAKSANH